MRVLTAPMLVVTLALLLASSATSGSLPPSTMRAETAGPIVVSISAVGADQPAIVIAAGTAAQWRNRDSIPHTVTADDGSFTSMYMLEGDSSALVSLPPGTHPYHIDRVSNVTGTITVSDTTPAPATTASPIGASSPTLTPGASATAGATTPTTDLATPTVAPTSANTATGAVTPSNTPTTMGAAVSATPAATDTGAATPTSTATGTPFATVPVTIGSGMLDPVTVTVTMGVGVRWTNLQTFPVSLTQDGSVVLVLAQIPPGGSVAYLFPQEGT